MTMTSLLRCFALLSLALSPVALADGEGGQTQNPRSYQAVAERGNTCALGLLGWCLVEQASPEPAASVVPVEVDLWGSYKFGSDYYTVEVSACESVGCTLDQTGWSQGVAINYRTTGNGRQDQDFGFGLAISHMPVVTDLSNNPGFDGELGPVSAGEGTLGYTNVRAIMRRRHFFYLLRSRYLVSTFGFGFAVPNASEAGQSFAGGRGIQPTLGGRFGLQIPITDRVEVGLVDHWGVWWYGSKFTHSSFMSSYGIHLTARL